MNKDRVIVYSSLNIEVADNTIEDFLNFYPLFIVTEVSDYKLIRCMKVCREKQGEIKQRKYCSTSHN